MPNRNGSTRFLIIFSACFHWLPALEMVDTKLCPNYIILSPAQFVDIVICLILASEQKIEFSS